MAQKKNRFATAIEEYFDTHVSDERRDEIRIFIRDASADTAEDKETLKAAVFEPRFRALLNSIEIELLHAIKKRPEEEDREFLVDMLDQNIEPGWLVYAMPVVWDDRYIPWLLQKSRESPRSLLAIEVLGHMQVMQAVSVLEEALNDPDDAVRRNAAIALKRVTGIPDEHK